MKAWRIKLSEEAIPAAVGDVGAVEGLGLAEEGVGASAGGRYGGVGFGVGLRSSLASQAGGAVFASEGQGGRVCGGQEGV